MNSSSPIITESNCGYIFSKDQGSHYSVTLDSGGTYMWISTNEYPFSTSLSGDSYFAINGVAQGRKKLGLCKGGDTLLVHCTSEFVIICYWRIY